MAIDVTSANTYFESHARGSIWAPLDGDVKSAALAHAIRLGKRLLVEVSDWVTTTTDDDDHPRYDAGAYEQALWLLENSPQLREGNTSLPLQLATDPEQKGGSDHGRKPAPMIYSPEALRYWTGGERGAYQVRLCRG